MAVSNPEPRGHYLANEVGRLAGVSGKKIGQWARRGYIRSTWAVSPPLVYSYYDVAEAMVVHELEARGIEPRAIGTAVANLRLRFGTEWPLHQADLMVPKAHPQAKGKSKTLALVEGDEITDLRTDHLVLGELDLIRIAEDLSRGGWAARDLPNLRHIEVNPNRLSGRPTIRGRRLSAEAVADIATSAEGWDTLRKGYGLKVAEIRDAVQWWEKVQSYEAAA